MTALALDGGLDTSCIDDTDMMVGGQIAAIAETLPTGERCDDAIGIEALGCERLAMGGAWACIADA